MNERERRIGENEVLYREVNERVLELSEQFGLAEEEIEIVCECGRGDCVERIRLGLRAYEHVRADAAQFAIVPGHEFPDVEVLVEEHADYAVVRKRKGGPAELASRNA